MEITTQVENWIIIENHSKQYFEIENTENNTRLFTQGEAAEDFLRRLIVLGTNTDFIDWFYDNEYDTIMVPGEI